MIILTCTKCQATLEMDDAFAGGVCRCQHCGTIQTVPARLKQGGRPAAPTAGDNDGPKALYSIRAPAGTGGNGSGGNGSGGNGRGSHGSPGAAHGLDDLATAVASSGISSGLADRRPTAPYAAPAALYKPPPRRTGLFVALGAAGGVVGLGVLAWVFVLRPGSAPSPSPGGTAPGDPVESVNTAKPSPAALGPHFATLPLDAKRVVFVIDRGNASQEVFDPLKAALIESLTSLGPEREFQVLFWTTEGQADAAEFAYPKGGTAKGNPGRVDDLRKQIEDVSAGGATDVGPAIREAMRRDPDAVVIATAKGSQLDEQAFVTPVLDARGGRPVAIHTVDLDRTGDGRPVLEAVAKRTGGQYKHVGPGELRAR